MSKNSVVNPFVQSLKAQIVSRLPELADGIDVNPRSAWVKGEVSPDAQKVLKDAGFVVCSKGWYFTHECLKMPKFAPVAPVAPAKAQKPEKAQKWAELPEATRKQIVRTFERAYPGAVVEVRGTWVFLIGGVFQTNAEYRERAKADGFHFGFKAKEWSRALTQEEIAGAEKPQAEPAPAPVKPAQTEPAHDAEAVDELQKLSEIVIRARKGEMSRDEMIAAMKEACPF